MVDVHNEILQVADVVAREKGIDRELVLVAMEEAIQKIARTKYGMDNDIRASIHRKTGEISVARHRAVVSELDTEAEVGHQILAEEAQAVDPTLSVGDVLIEALPPVEFGRMAAQTARQIISQRVREAERERQFAEFKDRIGEVVSGVVKRVEFGNFIIDVGRNECLLRRDEAIPRENLRPGDRVRAYVLDVNPELRGHQILLSRSHPQFMAKLFQQEVPEIYDGVIEVLAIARDPGSRAKIAVRTNDSSIDPVGSCVGVRGSRVQAVVNELQGERVDIVTWSEDTPTLIINALAPAEISRVIYDEEAGKVEVVVPDDQLSLAIGRRGQNVRLASLLTNLDVSITSESDDTEHRAEAFKKNVALFCEALDIDDVIAHLLITEGYDDIADIANATLEDLADIEGFEEEIAVELQSRAKDYILSREKAQKAELATLNLADDLASLEGFTTEMLIRLGKAGHITRDDVADLSGDELQEILGEGTLTLDEANELIMRARAHWFDDADADQAANS